MPMNYKLVMDDTTIFNNKNISSENIFSNNFFFLSGNVFTFFIFHITNIWYLVFKTLIIIEKLILKPAYKNQNIYHITSLIYVTITCDHNSIISRLI